MNSRKGKMWGVLVVQLEDETYSYLGTVSGKLPENIKYDSLISSVFDVSIGDYFFNRGMTELTKIGDEIKNTNCPTETDALQQERKQKSIALQQRLF